MAEAYCRMVVAEQVPACKLVRLACARYLRMLEDEMQDELGFYFSDESAVEACAFIEGLKHIKGDKARQPFIMEPWQVFKTCAIFAFRWADSGTRCVRVVYLEEPRKHGKSLWAAAVGIYLTTVEAGVGDDLYIIAPKFDQGLKVLEPFQKMCAADKALTSFFSIESTTKKSHIGKTDSGIIVLAALGEKQDGHDPKIVIADEFHAMPAEIYKVMKSAQRARSEALFLMIGSAGRFTFGVGWQEHCNAVKTLEGENGPALHQFSLIFTIDPEDVKDWGSQAVIAKANPGLGVSVDVRGIMQEAHDARTKPADKVEFLRTALNLWGHSEAVLIPKDKWDRCARPSLTLDQMRGLRGHIGIDLASRNDMVCLAAIFERQTGNVVQEEGQMPVPEVDLYAFAWHFVPESGPWTEDADLVASYRMWHEAGHLTFTPGSMHNFAHLERLLDDLCEKHDIDMVVVDDQQANEVFARATKKELPVQSFRKNAGNFSDPTKDLMARVNGEAMRLFHDGNPVLAWNVQNVIGGYDTADRILGKKVAPNSPLKIDGFDCLVMANASRLEKIAVEAKAGPQPMAERGMRIL